MNDRGYCSADVVTFKPNDMRLKITVGLVNIDYQVCNCHLDFIDSYNWFTITIHLVLFNNYSFETINFLINLLLSLGILKRYNYIRGLIIFTWFTRCK